MALLSESIRSSLTAQVTSIVSGATQLMVAGVLYVLTNTATATTLTLPASPTVGDRLKVSNFTNRSDTTVLRNGSNIMQAAVTITLDNTRNTTTFQYVSIAVGWVVSSSRSSDSYSV